MKGLILSGGAGTRLRPLTFTSAKQLIPIVNKPILFYVVSDLVEAGITDIGIIISPETGEEIQTALGDGSQWDARFTFILQKEPLGLAHAVKTARDFLADASFVMYLGDNVLSGGIHYLVKEFEQDNVDSIVLLVPVENPSQFGVAVLDGSGNIVDLEEKPKQPKSNLALVGVYVFNSDIHGIIDKLTPSWRNEYEITDAIRGLIESGRRVISHRVQGWWKDTGNPDDLLEANRLLLGQIVEDLQGEVIDSTIGGDVVLEAGAQVVGSSVRGPVHIAAGARIENSYIGPYTSIGAGVLISNSEVEHSIILNDAQIRDLSHRVDSSVIGRSVVVSGHQNSPRKQVTKLVLGDYSQVWI